MHGLARAAAIGAVALAAGFGGAVRTSTFTWVASFVIGAAVSWLVGAALDGPLVVARRRLDPLLLAFLLVAAVSTWRSINPWASRLELHRIGIYALFWLLCNQLLTSRRDLRYASGVVVLLGFGLVLAGLSGIQPTAADLDQLLASSRMRSTFVSANHFAGFVAMSTLVATGLAFAVHGSRRVLAAGLAMSGLVAVLLSASRGGLLSLVAGVAVLLAARVVAGHGRDVLAAMLVAGLAAGVGYGVTPAATRARFATVLDPESATAARRELWRAAAELVAERPWLGYGPGTFRERFSSVQPGRGASEVRRAHSDYLELAVEMGLVGLASAAGGLGLLLAAVVRLVRRKPDPTQAVGLGALAACVAAAVQAIAEFNFRSPANVLLFVVCAAIASAAAEAPWRASPCWLRIDCHGFGRWLVVAVAVAGGAMVAVELARPYRCERLLDEARAVLLDGRYDDAAAALERARALAPQDVALVAEAGGLELTRALGAGPSDDDRRGRIDDALALYQQAVDRAPHNADYRRGQARALASAGRDAAAVDALLEMLRLRPNDPWAQLEVGIFLGRDLGRRADAFDHVRRAVALDPRELLAPALEFLGPEVDPLMVIPATAEGHRALARYLQEQDPARVSPGLAGLNLGRAYELEPTASNAVRHLRALTESSAPERGWGEIVDRDIAAHPQDVAVHRAAVGLARRMGDRARQLGILQRLTRLEPAEPLHRVGLARVLHELGRLADAEAELRRSLGIDANLAEAWYELGLLARSQGDRDRAREHFERAVALSPDHGLNRLRLAEELHHVGRDADALRELEACMATDPAQERCRQLYGLVGRSVQPLR